MRRPWLDRDLTRPPSQSRHCPIASSCRCSTMHAGQHTGLCHEWAANTNRSLAAWLPRHDGAEAIRAASRATREPSGELAADLLDSTFDHGLSLVLADFLGQDPARGADRQIGGAGAHLL